MIQATFKKSNTLFLLIALSIAGTNPLLAQDCKVLDPNLVGTYTGDCKSGKASGVGKAVGKYTYEGEFKYGLPEGKGKLTIDSGNYYKGNFKKGKRDGQGTGFFKNVHGEDSLQSGFWKNDVFIGQYESIFKVVNKTFMVSGVDITFENPTPPNSTIELSMESVSGGAFNVHGEIPKPTLGEAIFQKGSYQIMMPITNQQKRNTYIFQNLIYPAHILFKINNEEIQVEFNEAKNYKIFVTLRD
jgi:hypothetical protein